VLETCGRASLLSQLSAPDVKTPAPVTETDLSQRLMTVLAQAIGVDRAETIDREVPMVAIGLDSLQALEVRRRVKIEFNHDLEVADLLGGASIADVLAQLGG
jgi:mycobactin polyketide synthetase MbtD